MPFDVPGRYTSSKVSARKTSKHKTSKHKTRLDTVYCICQAFEILEELVVTHHSHSYRSRGGVLNCPHKGGILQLRRALQSRSLDRVDGLKKYKGWILESCCSSSTTVPKPSTERPGINRNRSSPDITNLKCGNANTPGLDNNFFSRDYTTSACSVVNTNSASFVNKLLIGRVFAAILGRNLR